MTGTVWEAEGEAVGGDRERGNKVAFVTGSQRRAAAVSSCLCCTVLHCLLPRESREMGKKLGR